MVDAIQEYSNNLSTVEALIWGIPNIKYRLEDKSQYIKEGYKS